MPRPDKEAQTLASRVLAMVAEGAAPAEVAQSLTCSPAYVRVCALRARMLVEGYRRTSYGATRVMTDDERAAFHQAAQDLEPTTKRYGQSRRQEQRERARVQAIEINARRAQAARQQKERDDMLASSINRRRAHVNRILQAWKETA
jgi:hypothetical protein